MVVFCAFMVGLHNLYWYYPKDVRKHVELVENNVTTEAEQHFGMYVLGVYLWLNCMGNILQEGIQHFYIYYYIYECIYTYVHLEHPQNILYSVFYTNTCVVFGR